jgi:hypothetical protein
VPPGLELAVSLKTGLTLKVPVVRKVDVKFAFCAIAVTGKAKMLM